MGEGSLINPSMLLSMALSEQSIFDRGPSVENLNAPSTVITSLFKMNSLHNKPSFLQFPAVMVTKLFTEKEYMQLYMNVEF